MNPLNFRQAFSLCMRLLVTNEKFPLTEICVKRLKAVSKSFSKCRQQTKPTKENPSRTFLHNKKRG